MEVFHLFHGFFRTPSETFGQSSGSIISEIQSKVLYAILLINCSVYIYNKRLQVEKKILMFEKIENNKSLKQIFQNLFTIELFHHI